MWSIMSIFARRVERPVRKIRRQRSVTPETESEPNLNLQLLREKPEHASSEQVLALQRAVGNTAARQVLGSTSAGSQRRAGVFIQRMPTSTTVENTLGKPKQDKKIFGKTKLNSTKYKAVLSALRAFESYCVTTYLAPDASGLRDQMTHVNTLLQTIYDRMNAYQGKKGKKAVYMLGHMGEVKTFQNIAARAFLNKMDNPGSTGHHFLGTSLNSFLSNAMRQGGERPLELDSNDQLGSMGGGSKTVDQYDLGNGTSGFFSDKKNTLNDIDPMGGSEEWDQKHQEITRQVREEAVQKGWSEDKIQEVIFKRKNALTNEYYLGTGEGSLGIDPNDARMNNRDIAMSRLDQLLGTNLIARAQFAVVHMPNGTDREGSIMAEAKGHSPNEIVSDVNKLGGSSKEEIIENRKEAMGMDDPELMRQLSRLQLIDLIAFQVDRNTGNYFIQRDRSGKLTGITGIDNDFAFGTNYTDPDKQMQQLPGISRYVDKELAQTIIALDPSLLEAILSDLLPKREIDAAIARLKKLQAELQSHLTHLLEPDEWSAHAQDIVNEKKSYYYNLYDKVTDKR
jgi:hypothetical protein